MHAISFLNWIVSLDCSQELISKGRMDMKLVMYGSESDPLKGVYVLYVGSLLLVDKLLLYACYYLSQLDCFT